MKKQPTVAEQKAAIHAERLAHYRAHRSVVGEALLRAALRAHAATDAVLTVNRMLPDDFGLVDVALEQREAAQSIATVLRTEVTHILASHSALPADAQVRLVDRLIARMVPLRDNQQAGLKREPDQLRTQDLQRLIEQDLKAAYGPKGKTAIGAK